jgi:uncharacterized protein (DUF2461 family)
LSYSSHFAGSLSSELKWQRERGAARRRRQQTFAVVQIPIIDGSGPHLHENFIGFNFGQRDLNILQDRRIAILKQTDSHHTLRQIRHRALLLISHEQLVDTPRLPLTGKQCLINHSKIWLTEVPNLPRLFEVSLYVRNFSTFI